VLVHFAPRPSPAHCPALRPSLRRSPAPFSSPSTQSLSAVAKGDCKAQNPPARRCASDSPPISPKPMFAYRRRYYPSALCSTTQIPALNLIALATPVALGRQSRADFTYAGRWPTNKQPRPPRRPRCGHPCDGPIFFFFPRGVLPLNTISPCESLHKQKTTYNRHPSASTSGVVRRPGTGKSSPPRRPRAANAVYGKSPNLYHRLLQKKNKRKTAAPHGSSLPHAPLNRSKPKASRQCVRSARSERGDGQSSPTASRAPTTMSRHVRAVAAARNVTVVQAPGRHSARFRRPVLPAPSAKRIWDPPLLRTAHRPSCRFPRVGQTACFPPLTR